MIKDEIQAKIYQGLKQHDRERVDALRFLLSQIKYREIDLGKDITDEDTIKVLQSELKKRHEAIEMFRKGNREDLVAKNQKEIRIIKEFLPEELSAVEINKIIDDIISKTEKPISPGKIIGKVISQTKGRADGSKIAQRVNQLLNKK